MSARKPAALALVDGTHRPTRHGSVDAAKDAIRRSRNSAPMRPPAWLAKVAKTEWRRVEPYLRAKGLTEPGDRAALACYCRAWAELIVAQKAIDKHGLIYVTDTGNAFKHPAVAIANNSADQIRKFCIEFGFTPSSRSRLSIKPAAKSSGVADFAAGRDGAESK